MIQRIQSIFLLLASGACLSLLGIPMATTGAVREQSTLFADARFELSDDGILLGLFLAGGALLFLAIFLFKNRRLQMTLSLFAVAVIVGGAAWGGYLFSRELPLPAYDIKLGAAMPLLSIVFALLAYNRIRKDETLVRSMDRLR